MYEKLATNEEELSTDELIALAKALAENRRANVRPSSSKGQPSDNTEATPSTGELPGRFADAVRQVYGTNLPAADRENGNGEMVSPKGAPPEQRIGGVGE